MNGVGQIFLYLDAGVAVHECEIRGESGIFSGCLQLPSASLVYFSFSILSLFTLTLAKNTSDVYYPSREFYGTNYHRVRLKYSD